jgi:hypothetical protein
VFHFLEVAKASIGSPHTDDSDSSHEAAMTSYILQVVESFPYTERALGRGKRGLFEVGKLWDWVHALGHDAAVT